MSPALADALAKRGRTWGAENSSRIRAMRDEIADLKANPRRWARRMTHLLTGKRHMGDGCYMGSRMGGIDTQGRYRVQWTR